MKRILIFLVLSIFLSSCCTCTTDVESIRVDYDDIDDITFRSIPPSDFDFSIENYNDHKTFIITNKCDIRSIVDEFDYVIQQNDTTSNIDTRMRFSISRKDTVEFVYLGLNSIMINGRSYRISNKSLKNILKIVDDDQLRRIKL